MQPLELWVAVFGPLGIVLVLWLLDHERHTESARWLGPVTALRAFAPSWLTMFALVKLVDA